jgi:DNA-binding protein YbaB
MTDPVASGGRFADRLAGALAELEEQRRKLTEMQRAMTTTTTKVHARDRLLTVTFDGRGDVTKIEFDGFRYRKLAPGELGKLIVDTIAAGRRQAIEKIGAMMGGDPLPGVSFTDLATNARPAAEVLDSFLGAALDRLPAHVRGRAEQMLRGAQ